MKMIFLAINLCFCTGASILPKANGTYSHGRRNRGVWGTPTFGTRGVQGGTMKIAPATFGTRGYREVQ